MISFPATRAPGRTIPLSFRFGAVVGFGELFPGEYVMMLHPIPPGPRMTGRRPWVGIVLHDIPRSPWAQGELVTISALDTGIEIVDDGPDL